MRLLKSGKTPYDRALALRYMGYSATAELTEEDGALIALCESELLPLLSYTAVYETYPIVVSQYSIDLGFAVTRSKNLRRNLNGCNGIFLFASTVGAAPDRLVRRYLATNPSRAAVMQAIGASAEESWCQEINDTLSAEAAANGFETCPRFSPGYGDLALDLQREIFIALGAEKRLGITLTDGYLMLPTKSVTAIIGIKK